MTKRVLIIEDDKAIARLLRDNLEYEGFVVETCDNGHDALAVGQAVHAGSAAPRPDAPAWRRRLRHLPGAQREPDARAGDHPVGPRAEGGPHPGTDARRRRLRDEALRPRRTAGAGARGAAPDQAAHRSSCGSATR